MGAPAGNQNAAKAKTWEGALRSALAQYEDKDAKIEAGQALRKIAHVVVTKAIAGDKDAIKEIGDRLDGKPVQAIAGHDGSSLILEVVKFATPNPGQ